MINIMNNKKIIIIASVFVSAVGLGLLLGFYILPKWTNLERPYYGVLLASGDFYVGRLSRLPAYWKLSDAFLLRSVADPDNPGQSTFSLVPIKEASIWSPEALMINPKNVIFWGRVGKQSEVMRALVDLPQVAPSGAPQAPAQNTLPPQTNQNQ